MAPFPLIDVSGPPYQRGFQHGRACGDLIRRYPDVLRTVLGEEAQLRSPGVSVEPPSDTELFRRARLFLPWIEEFAPEQVEEIRGVAAGAEVPFELALLVNVRAEVAGVGHFAECTGVALGRRATADGSMLIGQNQDQDEAMRELVVVLRVEPDRGPRMLMVTFAGLLGYNGLNSAGIGYTMNALANSVWRMGMPHYPLKRALLQQTSLAGCLAQFARAKVGSCGNNLLVDRNGMMDVEWTPDAYEVIEPDPRAGDFLVHTNHFRTARLAADEQYLPKHPDSADRCDRMEELVRERHGKLTVEDLKGFFADHEGFPTSICCHTPSTTGNASHTIFSVICEPDRGQLHVSVGNPCQSEYFTYRLE